MLFHSNRERFAASVMRSDTAFSRLRAQCNPIFPTLVPLFRKSQILVFATVVIAWAVSFVYFWNWWLQPHHNVGTIRYVFNTAVFGWLTLLPLFFIVVVRKSLVPNPFKPVPQGLRVAMVATKSPSEPFLVVRQTLQAMLRQTYRHDTWLADEDPSEETLTWCEEHGVSVSSRKGHADYHNASWPRRARCKEGNLAYFYDHYGYSNYDFVSQLDADHVPTPTYLAEVLRPFSDPQIGYVSAPSICDGNAAGSWSARGRLFVEGPVHGILQAGYTGGLAPLCIGSHYAVRTEALRQIGGLGPELAEDHSTTLMMNAAGWRGAHALNAIAHGDGPNTFADMITQEFQWSRSLITIFLKHSPTHIPKLPWSLKFQFAFCQLWYPIVAFVFLSLSLMPIIALAFDAPMVDVLYLDFLQHLIWMPITIFLLLWWIARQGWLRPVNAKMISWEAMLYVPARWPWWLAGTAAAVYDSLRGSTAEFRVTPKGTSAAGPLPIRVVAPYAVLATASGLAVLLFGNVQDAVGFYILALLNCILYTALVVVIIAMHAVENAAQARPDRQGWAWRSLLQAGLLAFVIAIPLIAAPVRAPVGLSAILWLPGPQ